MSKMVQIRDVPDAVHSVLKSRAAREGMSLSDYIKRELRRTVDRPSMLEWLDRVQQIKPVRPGRSSAEIIREIRDGASR